MTTSCVQGNNFFGIYVFKFITHLWALPMVFLLGKPTDKIIDTVIIITWLWPKNEVASM